MSALLARIRRALCLPLLLLTAVPIASSQADTPAPDPLLQLSPQAAYDQALLPIGIVHRSIANWSDSEMASLGVAIAQAQAFCKARPAAQLTGPSATTDLLGLARLCALGAQWPAVLDATNRLLDALPVPAPIPVDTLPSPAVAATPRAQALAFKIEAALNLQDAATALATGQLLLATEPYTPLSQQSTDGLLRYLQLIQTGNALNLAGKRLDRILPLLRASGSPAPQSTGPSAATAPLPVPPSSLSAHELYTAALAVPTLLQLGNNVGAAAGSLATIEGAVPTSLPPDEAILIALARRHYTLLDAVLPQIPASVSLFNPSETPRVNRQFGAATVLLVFPDWCAQCVRTAASGFMPFLTRHAGDDIHLYGLLAQPKPPPVAAPPPPSNTRHARPPAAAPSSQPATPPTAADLLRGTPTLVVAADLPLTAFATTDFPLLVVTDHEGRIRFAEVAPENAFIPGALADQVVARVVELWPPPSHP